MNSYQFNNLKKMSSCFFIGIKGCVTGFIYFLNFLKRVK